jgi:hypothetical protein
MRRSNKLGLLQIYLDRLQRLESLLAQIYSPRSRWGIILGRARLSRVSISTPLQLCYQPSPLPPFRFFICRNPLTCVRLLQLPNLLSRHIHRSLRNLLNLIKQHFKLYLARLLSRASRPAAILNGSLEGHGGVSVMACGIGRQNILLIAICRRKDLRPPPL